MRSTSVAVGSTCIAERGSQRLVVLASALATSFGRGPGLAVLDAADPPRIGYRIAADAPSADAPELKHRNSQRTPGRKTWTVTQVI
jgi:hypothetical protein